MRIYLAGISSFVEMAKGAVKNDFSSYVQTEKKFDPKPFYMLESFYYIRKEQIALIPKSKDFLLDSGAFSFMVGTSKPKFEDYLDNYIAFINEHNIKHFFELDIDNVVEYERVKEYRRRLEKGTGKQCIPVWHKSRGKQEFLKMCDEYPYVAIGGIVSGEIQKNEYKYFPWFIEQAHNKGSLIHGLGFTNLQGLTKYHFDTVDSTAWISGNRFGGLYKFNGTTLIKANRPKGKKMRYRETVCNNFTEWTKFAAYAENHL